jgi:UDP-glucuronate 4-epimerase
MLCGKEIMLFGDGSSARDYTYIDDIIEGIISALYFSGNIYELFNLGNSQPIMLKDLVTSL